MRKIGSPTRTEGLVLGIDAGGTKTLAAVADMNGRVLGLGRAGCGNFQGNGKSFARIEIANAIEQAIKAASANPGDIIAAGYGVAGADREADFDIVREILDPIDPSGAFVLCNDTTLALRAGTRDGIGVASVAGTGSNTMGFNAAGEHVKVGGFGPFSGDQGSSADLIWKAIVACFREADGRGPKTLLSKLIAEELGVPTAVDIVELTYFDSERSEYRFNGLAPLVFRAAKMGDRVAREILRKTGRECAANILSCMKRLFPDRREAVPLVLGGSVFQKGEDPAMVDALSVAVRRIYPNVRIIRLADEPCVGALILAYDLVLGKTAPVTLQRAVKRGFAEAFRVFG